MKYEIVSPLYKWTHRLRHVQRISQDHLGGAPRLDPGSGSTCFALTHSLHSDRNGSITELHRSLRSSVIFAQEPSRYQWDADAVWRAVFLRTTKKAPPSLRGVTGCRTCWVQLILPVHRVPLAPVWLQQPGPWVLLVGLSPYPLAHLDCPINYRAWALTHFLA